MVLTGFNTDVTFEGVVYHVQTEDRGLDAPVLDTLVYCGGQILHQEKHSYEDLIDNTGDTEAMERILMARLDAQHRDFVRRTRHGEFAAGAPTLGALTAEGASFTGALHEFLDRDEEVSNLELTWEPDGGEAAGLCGKLRVTRDGQVPAEGEEIRITARLVARGLNPVSLLDTVADEAGEVAVAVALPPGSQAAVIFAGVSGLASGRLRVSLDCGEVVSSGDSAGLAESRVPEPSS